MWIFRCTKKGIVVMNTPGDAISTAEHTNCHVVFRPREDHPSNGFDESRKMGKRKNLRE